MKRKHLLKLLLPFLLFLPQAKVFANAGIWGAGLTLNSTATRNYGSGSAETVTGFSILTTSLGGSTKQLFGAQASGFNNSTNYTGVVNNDLVLYYNIHLAGQPIGTFSSFALPNANTNYWRKAPSANPVLDLLTLVNNQVGNYVLEWYIVYSVRNQDNNTDIPSRFPQTGNHKYTFQIKAPDPLADTYPKFFVDGKVVKKKTAASDPGSVFQIKGANVNGFNWNWDFRNNLEDSTKIINVWGFNTIRLTCYIYSREKGSTARFWDAGDDGKLAQMINYFTSKGIVCMIEAHDATGWFPPVSETQDTVNKRPTLKYMSQWWKNKALEYRNNQYVWFNIMNEPGFIEGTDYAGNTSIRNLWKSSHKAPIEAIRETDAPNVIVVDAISFAAEAAGYGTVLDASPHRSNAITAGMSSVLTDGAEVKSYDTKGNVVFAVHPYTIWETPGKFKNYMNLINQANMPVIVGECMPTFRDDGGAGWRAGWGSRALWELLKYYRETGTSVSSGWIIWHWDDAGVQKLAYNHGGSYANTSSYSTRPTNLSREGFWVWDQIHSPGSIKNYYDISSTASTRLQIEQAMTWKDAEEISPNGTGTDDRYTGSTDANSWTEWDINVAAAGTYKITLRGNNKSTTDATFEVRNYSGTVIAVGVIPANTTADGDFKTSSFPLSAGQQILRISRLEGVNAQYTYFDIAPGAPDTQAPSVPTAIAAFSRTNAAITLQWNVSTDNEGIRSYEITRGGTVIGTTSKPYYADRGLTAQTAYSYSIKAVDFSGNKSAASGSVTVATVGTLNFYSIDDKTEGTGLNQVKYNAKDADGRGLNGWVQYSDAVNFGGTEVYTTQNNATIEIQFSGTQARMYGTRKSSHGTMAVSIDGGTEYNVPASFITSGADERGVFIFATPELTNATHTIKLRNLGSYVSFDRLEVITEALSSSNPGIANGTYEIINGRGQAIDVAGGSWADGAKIQQYFNNHSNSQKFTVTLVSGTYYKIVNKFNNKALTLSSDVTTETDVVQKTFASGNDSFLWSFESLGSGFYKMVNKRSGLVLSADNGTGTDLTADGTKLEQRVYNTANLNGQKWKLNTTSARLGLKEENPASTIEIYPNPASDKINVSLTTPQAQQVSLQVFNLQGKTLMTHFQTVRGAQIISLPLNLTPGLYVLRVRTPDQQSAQKIIIE